MKLKSYYCPQKMIYFDNSATKINKQGIINMLKKHEVIEKKYE